MENILDDTPQELRHAGFGHRFGALLIDVILLGIINIVLIFTIGGGMDTMMGDPNQTDPMQAFMDNMAASWGNPATWLGWIIFFFYFIFFESSAGGATLGKQALGIRVVTTGGEQISTGTAALRTFIRFIMHASCCLWVLYFMALGQKKQGLHDVVAKTNVVFK